MDTPKVILPGQHLTKLAPNERMTALIQALNAAAAALLHTTYSEADVFRIFSEEMTGLGLEGTLFVYDAVAETLRIHTLNFPLPIMNRLAKIRERLGFDPFTQAFPIAQIPPMHQVVREKQPHFFSETAFFQGFFAHDSVASVNNLTKQAVIVAPFLHAGQVLGLLSVSGNDLMATEMPLIAAFANQIAVALMNARLIAAARQTEQKYRRLFELAPVMYVVTRDQSGKPYIVECNQLLADTLGYRPEELVGHYLGEFYSPASVRQLEQGGYQRALQGHFVNEERQLVTRQGTILETIVRAFPETDNNGQVIGTRAMFIDITPRKQAEAELQNYQTLLKKSFDEINILIPASAIVAHATQNEEIIQDIAEYMAAAFNCDGCALYCWDSSSQLLVPLGNMHRVRSLGWVRMEREDTRDVVTPSPAVLRALQEKVIVSLEFYQPSLSPADELILSRHQSKNVLLIPLVVRHEVIGLAELYTYEDRHFTPRELLFVHTLSSYLTIGLENARLFDKLRHTNEALEYRVEARTQELQTRNQELDAFAHTVAHDLQAILARVIMYAEIVADRRSGLTPEQQGSYAQTILQDSRKMKEVVESLYLLATMGKADIRTKPLDMAIIISDSLRRLEGEINTQQATLRCPENWPVVIGNQGWVETVWVNYLSNALRYGGTPPIITLTAQVIDRNMAQFGVRDEGPGLPPEDQERIFHPFTQLQGGERGLGLGLSIVKRIVERLGGDAGVHSEPGKGSHFYFTLPLADTP
ncbi:MAG: PAS domain-containing sensor histidine kinase [Candidatus Promineifilaceae bacterium]